MIRSFVFAFISAILLFFGYSVLCQDFPMLHYTIEDGLPSNNVYDIYKDSKGYLWICTDKGVARYNGIKFESFTTHDGLPDNEIFSTKEDCYGRQWFTTYSGELCFYKDGIFHTAGNTSFLKLPFKASFVKYIFLDKDSSVGFSFNEQPYYVSIKHDELSFHTVKIDSLNLLEYVYKINDSLYKIILSHTIRFVDKNFKTISNEPVTYNKMTYNMPCQDENYFINDSLIFSFDKKVYGTFEKHFFDKYQVQRVYFDSQDKYFATNKGLFINDSLHILQESNCSSIARDKAGDYWFGTLNNGIFVKYANYAKVLKKAYEGKVRYSCFRGDHIFFTTDNNNLFTVKDNKAQCLFNYSLYKKEKITSAREAVYLLDDHYKYWSFYSRDNIVIENVLKKPLSVKHYINSQFQTGFKSVLLIGSDVYLQNRRNIISIDYSKLKAGETMLRNPARSLRSVVTRIYGMAKDVNNTLWFSTIENVYKLEDSDAVVQSRFKNISLKSINFFGNYLVGNTHSNQLMICSGYNDKLKIDSIPFQNCIWDKFYQLDTEHILVSTNNLYRLLTLYPPKSDRKCIVTVIENPYIPLDAESICSDSSYCYFFKNGDITSVEIKSLLLRSGTPELFFRWIKAGKKSYAVDSEIQLTYGESKNVVVSFSTVSFSGKDITYQYSVSRNAQDNWRPTGSEEVNLVNSGYGTYVIKVRAKTTTGDYSIPIELTLHISKPYWATWWFITLVVCVIGAVIGGVARYRILVLLHKKQKEHDTEIKFMKAEYRSLNALMNPHFIFNTLNNVQSLVNGNDKKAANEYLRVFADLVRQNMQNISKELISLQKETELVTNYLLLEKLRFEDRLNYEINISKEVDLSDIMVPPLLIQPLVENSIKHGILPLESTNGFVAINIYERGGTLFIEVRDNGVGIGANLNKQGIEHESYGLQNIRKRIEQLSVIQDKEITFKISAENDIAGKLQWTIVTITIPL